MSYGSFVHHSIAERKAVEAKRRDVSEKAKELVTEHMPELVAGGYVDGWAVWAALQLKREGRPFNATAVRRRRNQMSLGDKTVAEREKEGWS